MPKNSSGEIAGKEGEMIREGLQEVHASGGCNECQDGYLQK